MSAAAIHLFFVLQGHFTIPVLSPYAVTLEYLLYRRLYFSGKALQLLLWAGLRAASVKIRNGIPKDMCYCYNIYIYIYVHIQGAPAGLDKTSGECSLC